MRTEYYRKKYKEKDDGERTDKMREDAPTCPHARMPAHIRTYIETYIYAYMQGTHAHLQTCSHRYLHTGKARTQSMNRRNSC